MEEQKFKLKLDGPGLQYETEIDAVRATSIIQLCLGPVPAASSPSVETLSGSPATQGDQIREAPQSFSEYMKRIGPKRNPDKILTICGYLINVKGQGTVAPEEIKPYFQQAGEPLPANFGRDFRRVISNGWITESPDERNRFYVTNSGKRALNSCFSKEVVKRTQLSPKGRRRRTKKKIESGIREEDN